MDDSVITCDEIIEEIVPANFNEKKATCKTQISIFYFHFSDKISSKTKTFITILRHK